MLDLIGLFLSVVGQTLTLGFIPWLRTAPATELVVIFGAAAVLLAALSALLRRP